MSNIEEKATVQAPANIIWKIWTDSYLKAGVEVGKKGYVVTSKKKGVKFKIKEVKENEKLTIIWYSLMVKLIFYHTIEVVDNKSIVTCKVKFKGFLSFLIKPLIAKKIKESIKMSLNQLSKNLKGF